MQVFPTAVRDHDSGAGFPLLMLRLIGVWLLVCLGISVGCSHQAPTPKKPSATDTSAGNGAQEVDVGTTVNARKNAEPPAWLAEVTAPYVGSDKCGECHRDRAAEFAATAHAKSLQTVAPASEATDQMFVHPPSNQRFDVVARNNSVVHRGFQELPGDGILPLAEVPIACVMGSGKFAKSYIFRDGPAAWVQAPLTYYMSTDSYGMSPGYDHRHHKGFTRQLTDQCFFCHAGLVTREDGNENHLTIHEMAIGCERCHGPGQNHVELAEAAAKAVGDVDRPSDWGVVHPGKLDRSRIESICAQCHLQGDLTLFTGTRNLWSYRPGGLLGETLLIYRFEDPRAESAERNEREPRTTHFVGHFEQLRQSACYLGDESLSCVTCHDPHIAENPAIQGKLQRSHCLSCHSDAHCGVPRDERLERNENQCWKCHMPSRKTEVPHVAITNHRIAVYPVDQESGGDPAAGVPHNRTPRTELPIAVPLLDRSPEGSWQRQLNEATAIAGFLSEQAGAEFHNSDVFESAIRKLRQAMLSRDTADETVVGENQETNLPVVSQSESRARLLQLLAARMRQSDLVSNESYRNQLESEVERLAKSIRSSEAKPNLLYQLATEKLASIASRAARNDEAAALYRELTGMRRFSADHYNLGLVLVRMQEFQHAEKAFYDALRIEGNYPRPYAMLSRLYRSIDPATSASYAALVRWLEQPSQPQ